MSPNSRLTVTALPVPAPRGPARGSRLAELLDGVSAVSTLSSCSLHVQPNVALPILQSTRKSVVLAPVPEGRGIRILEYQRTARGPAIVAAASQVAKVVVVGGWKMFLDGFIDDRRCQNGRLYQNILAWLTPTTAAVTAGTRSRRMRKRPSSARGAGPAG